MRELTERDRKVLEYVENTGGNATMDIFEDDWSPIGRDLLFSLGPMGWRLIKAVYDERRGRQFLYLTDEAIAILRAVDDRASQEGSEPS